jgi:hypothetical protein
VGGCTDKGGEIIKEGVILLVVRGHLLHLCPVGMSTIVFSIRFRVIM